MSILSNIPLDERHRQYVTAQQHILIDRDVVSLDPDEATAQISENIDHYKGALFSSNFEYTGRYTRWDVGFINPPIEMCAKGHTFSIHALNERGVVMLNMIYPHLQAFSEIVSLKQERTLLQGSLATHQAVTNEEERTKQTSIFNVIRLLKTIFHSKEDNFLGLYGSFGYDLIFQFEQLQMTQERADDQQDLILYLPDELIIVDHMLSVSYRLSYDFTDQDQGLKTEGLERTGAYAGYHMTQEAQEKHYQPGYYESLVKQAMPSFYKGDLYEVVPSQVLYKKCPKAPSVVFEHLQQLNPSPYGFIINLGEEFLVGSSPEMYVRVDGHRVETCPISGTIKRGENTIEDAENIKTLLNSHKDESELTMCTDVDRNDKSRICEPGSVKVIGRRQIETYSHLFHTVDHIEGTLRSEYDALDAFMTHMWAVTVTGAPKASAVQWIEDHEEQPRRWYGGAVGWFTFDGNLNTGLVLRTTRMKDGLAELRAGATLLHASDPESEEKETLVKLSALSKAIEQPQTTQSSDRPSSHIKTMGYGKRLLLIDHEDSFVHTLGDYFRQTGADVVTSRVAYARDYLQDSSESFDGVVLSPGPGRPERFAMSDMIQLCLQRHLPIFGVCLGFQGIAQYFGAPLKELPQPCHGEVEEITLFDQGQSVLFADMNDSIKVGRYHSLYLDNVPDVLNVTAQTEDGIIMAFEHSSLPVCGVQFHPESILSAQEDIGLQVIGHVMTFFKSCEVKATK